MTHPVNHHYVPRFLQRRWLDSPASEEAQVFRYTKPYREVVEKRVSTNASGSENLLYSRRLENDTSKKQEVESTFFSPLDDAAAKALAAIEGRPRNSPFLIIPSRPLPDALKRAWTLFLMSMVFRSPYRVRWMFDNLVMKWNEGKDLEGEYKNLRSPDDPDELAIWIAAHSDSLAVDAGALQILQELINSNLIVPHIMGSMDWQIIHVQDSLNVPEFMLSDEPVMTSNGLNKRDSFVLMPTSPRTLFIAANDAATIAAFRNQPPSVLAHAINDAVVRQAHTTIISRSGGHLDFVRERFAVSDSEPMRQQRMTWAAPIIFHDGLILLPG